MSKTYQECQLQKLGDQICPKTVPKKLKSENLDYFQNKDKQVVIYVNKSL